MGNVDGVVYLHALEPVVEGLGGEDLDGGGEGRDGEEGVAGEEGGDEGGGEEGLEIVGTVAVAVAVVVVVIIVVVVAVGLGDDRPGPLLPPPPPPLELPQHLIHPPNRPLPLPTPRGYDARLQVPRHRHPRGEGEAVERAEGGEDVGEEGVGEVEIQGRRRHSRHTHTQRKHTDRRRKEGQEKEKRMKGPVRACMGGFYCKYSCRFRGIYIYIISGGLRRRNFCLRGYWRWEPIFFGSVRRTGKEDEGKKIINKRTPSSTRDSVSYPIPPLPSSPSSA